MKCILASDLYMYDKNEEGIRIAKKIENQNSILDNLKKYIKKYDNFLYIPSDGYNYEITDMYLSVIKESFNLTLPFKNYKILDNRTINKIDEMLKEADLIFLSGGHVPTQNKFFNDINLKDKLKNTDSLIIGLSAGSMNMAKDVYSIPELTGESIDKDFKRTLPGLGLTNINVLPHYNEIKNTTLDDKDYIKDIVLPDTYERKVYALNDGSYILIDGKSYLYGEAYILKDGKIKQINTNNNKIIIGE